MVCPSCTPERLPRLRDAGRHADRLPGPPRIGKDNEVAGGKQNRQVDRRAKMLRGSLPQGKSPGGAYSLTPGVPAGWCLTERGCAKMLRTRQGPQPAARRSSSPTFLPQLYSQIYLASHVHCQVPIAPIALAQWCEVRKMLRVGEWAGLGPGFSAVRPRKKAEGWWPVNPRGKIPGGEGPPGRSGKFGKEGKLRCRRRAEPVQG
jgi:hypothetical protein